MGKGRFETGYKGKKRKKIAVKSIHRDRKKADVCLEQKFLKGGAVVSVQKGCNKELLGKIKTLPTT